MMSIIRISRSLLCFSLLFLTISFLSTTTSNALIFTVTNNNDGPPGSLRSAIQMANSNAGPDVINFNVTGTILLDDDINITDDLTINGPGADMLTLDSDDDDRIFNIDAEGEITVNINGLTFSNGSAEYGGAIFNRENLNIDSCVFENNEAFEGGAIFNGGEFNVNCILNITNTDFIGNDAANGGAIYNIGTIETIDDCSFIGNTAGDESDEPELNANSGQTATIGNFTIGNGGAIANVSPQQGRGLINDSQTANGDQPSAGVIELISDSLFQNNTAFGEEGEFSPCDVQTAYIGGEPTGGYGGAIYNISFIDVIETSAFIGNEALSNEGHLADVITCQTKNNGQIANIGPPGTSLGGAIYSGDILHIIRNSTFYQNEASTGGAMYIGGFENHEGVTVTANIGESITLVDFCTVAENTAFGIGDPVQTALELPNDEVGGIDTGNGGQVDLSNSIVANQINGADCDDVGVESLGNNIDSDGTCTDFASGDMPNTDPLLDPAGPQNNGGPTPTIALCEEAGTPPGCTGTSPAINNAGECDIINDQRFFQRSDPDSAACDIGAFEANSIPLFIGEGEGVVPAPTLSQWGMIVVAILTILSVLIFRRRLEGQNN